MDKRVTMTNIEKVGYFLEDAKDFYITTVDENNRPKSRPIGFKMLDGDKLYFGIGTFKDAYKQIENNPYIEIVATKADGSWIRYDGKAVIVKDSELENRCLDALGPIGAMYRENNWRMGMFYLTDAHVEIKKIMKTVEEFDL